MALNNYGPRGLLDTAPWSPAGLQAGSGLNRYTNMQPGGMQQPMRPDPVQMQQYQPPAMRSLADSLAQYKAPAAAAAAPPPLVGTPGFLPSEQIWQGSGGSSVDHSGVGAGGFDLGSFDLGSFASAIGADTAMSGARLGSLFGPIGTLAGGLLGYYTQQGNESARVANNNADMNTRAGLSNAEVSATPGLGGMGVSIGPGLGATLDGGFAGGQGFDVPTLGSSLAPAEAAPAPAREAAQMDGTQAAGMGGGLLGGFDSAPVPAPAPAATYEPVYGAKTFAPGTSPSGYNANSVTMNGMLLGYKNSVTGEVTPTKPAGGSGYVPTSTYANPYDTYFSNSSNPYSGYQTYGTSEGE